MDTTKAQELINKFHKGTLSADEEAILDGWYLSLSDEERTGITDAALESRKAAILHRLNESYGKGRTVKLWPRIAVAVAAVAAIVFGVWFFNSRYDMNVEPGTEVAKVNDVAPGRNGATITLGNGKVIALSDAKNGVIVGGDIRYNDGSAVEGNLSPSGRDGVAREGSGSNNPLSPQGGFNSKSSSSSGLVELAKGSVLPEGERSVELTASTAKGQTYQFTLPDGTKVWLNADSKLEFPSSFVNSKTRNVKLSGEGYFEVAKDKAHPFIVATKRQQIEVLGTHFNVSAYINDVAMKTTLFEGKVAVTEDGSRLTLDPGDQAYSGLDGVRAKTLMNPEAEIDWKNGDFIFRNEALGSIMSRVARWYNIEVVYAPGVDVSQSFSGSVSRSKPVSAILGIIQLTKQVKFKIEGRKVYVQ